jgi:putative membrane protein
MMNNRPNRLHPASIFILFVKSLRELALPLLIAFLLGRGGNYIPWISNYVLLGIGLCATLLFGILRWMTFSYTVDDGELRINQGVLIRKKRYIRQERIQSINTSQGLVQRLFGVVQIRIETAGGGSEPEVQLSAITKKEAEQLRDQLLSELIKEEEAEETKVVDTSNGFGGESEIVWKLSLKDLLITALTSSGVGLAFSAVGALFFQIDQFIPDGFFVDNFGGLMKSSLVTFFILIIAVVFIAWLLSTSATMLKYGGFTLRKRGDQLEISRGVLEKRQLTLSERRITAIRIVDTPLRQPFGYVSLYVESAGGGSKDEQLSTILFPLLHQKDLTLFLGQILPQFSVDMPIESIPRRAMHRYLIRSLLPTSIVLFPICYFIPYGYASLILLPLAFYLGYVQYCDAGYGRNERFVWLRSRLVNRTTVLVPRPRIQASESGQSFFQKRHGLANYKLSILSSIAGKSFRVIDMDEQESKSLLEWFSYRR